MARLTRSWPIMIANSGQCSNKYKPNMSISLTTVGVEPIFAKPNHPQTKGKIERFFGVVRQMWLGEERMRVESDPSYTLDHLNADFQEWLEYYNGEKPHRSLHQSTPKKVYFDTNPRVYRPLESEINRALWLNTTTQRKVHEI